MLSKLKFLATTVVLLGTLIPGAMVSAKDTSSKVVDAYEIQPGDVLRVSVWKEEDLIQEVIVRPDGQITFPLVGEAKAAGTSIESLRQLITDRLTKYIPDPVVTV
jgi:polysaccharide export outer membrane protein